MDVRELTNAVGLTRGHFASKANRIAKLIQIWDELESKFVSMVNRGKGETETARMAFATLLMMETGIRVGNETSAEGFVCKNQKVAGKDHKSGKYKKGDIIWEHPMNGQMVQTYGLTTLLHKHITWTKQEIIIEFVGKKIVDQRLVTKHPTLMAFCPLNGQADDLWLNIRYPDLKKFVKKYVGKNFTPKDIRMAKVNLLFIEDFGNDPTKKDYQDATTKSAKKKLLSEAIERTANTIGHTRAVCKSAYLSPMLISYIQEK